MASNNYEFDYITLYNKIYSDYYYVSWDPESKAYKRVKLTTPMVTGKVSLGPETNELGEVAP